MPATVERPRPEEYQPRLTWWGHTWRLLLMLLSSAGVWLLVAERQSEEQFLLDVAGGLPAFVLVWFRRRWPLTVAVLTAGLGGVSSWAAGPSILAAISLASRREYLKIGLVAAVNIAGAQLYWVVQPATSDPAWFTFITNVVAVSAILAWGMYIGSRRELLWTLRQRVERAEAEQELRVGQARGTERARIAREMHDVLAHKISQISMHAGALAFREDLGAQEMRASAQVIQQRAHEALTDLRSVLGVLRDGSTGEVLDRPQPTYADLPRLVAEARADGLHVDYDDGLAPGLPVPDAVGRTLYRIIQEGITNARKHAPGALLTIEVDGSPEDGVEFRLCNPLGFGPSATPGAGLGLIGLSERAELRGGRLEHRREGRTFVVEGWIPWAA